MDIPAEMLLTELIEEPAEAAFLGGIPSAPQASGAWQARALGRSPIRAGRPAWVIPAVVVAAIVVVGAVLWGSGVLRHMGIASGTVDIRKVIADPQAYAGQTLQSRVIIVNTEYYRGIGAVEADPLALMTSDSMEEKAMKVLLAVGEHQAVMIKYRVHDRHTFARARAREIAEDREAAAKEREFARRFETPEGGLDVEAMERAGQLLHGRDAQRNENNDDDDAKDPLDYQGVLLDIWIP